LTELSALVTLLDYRLQSVVYVTVRMSVMIMLTDNVDYVSKSADVVVDPEPSTSSAEPHADGDCCRQKLLQRAPVISYGSDLCFWGDNFELPLINR